MVTHSFQSGVKARRKWSLLVIVLRLFMLPAI